LDAILVLCAAKLVHFSQKDAKPASLLIGGRSGGACVESAAAALCCWFLVSAALIHFWSYFAQGHGWGQIGARAAGSGSGYLKKIKYLDTIVTKKPCRSLNGDPLVYSLFMSDDSPLDL